MLSAKEIIRISEHPQIIHGEILKMGTTKTPSEEHYKAIFSLLKSSFNVDFSHYKEATISRRIARRMVINHTDNIQNYINSLQSNPKELQALYSDMLIGVTNFFREPHTFERALSRKNRFELANKLIDKKHSKRPENSAIIKK